MAASKPATQVGRRGGGPFGGRRDSDKEERAVVEYIREATGASVEDIQYQLRECEGDVDKATEKLIDTPFTVVQSKKPKARVVGRGAPRAKRDHAGGRGRNSDGNGGRGRGGFGTPRGRGGHRNKPGNRGKVEAPEKEEIEINEEEKAKPVTPPAPVRKAYLEALCGKPKMATDGDTIKSGFLVQKEDFASFAASGWEAASSPPDTPVAAFRGLELTEDVPSEEDKSIKVDSVAELRNLDEKEGLKLCSDEVEEDTSLKEPSKPNAFPIEMQDIRFTREHLTPVVPLHLAATLKLDCTVEQVPDVNAQLDMSTINFLFGTFEGIFSSKAEPKAEVQETENLPSVEETAAETVVPFVKEDLVPERREPALMMPQTDTPEAELVQSLKRTSVEFLTPTDASQQLSLDTFSKPMDFRLDVGAQVLEAERVERVERPERVERVERPQPEQTSFLSQAPVKEEVPVRPMDTGRQEKPFIGSMPLQEKPFVSSLPLQDKPQQHQPLEAASNIVKAYESYSTAMENKKSEALPSFEPSEPRQQPHRQPTSISDTKPVLDTEPSYGISSGPTPTLPSYQPPRHQLPPHKLQEKSGPPPVGVPGHHPNPKYGAHPGGVVAGQTAAIHVPVSLNVNSSGTPSLPMMQQVPFLNPGMMPNPAMHFPPGGYYPQFMQYHQHQLYHGMYAGAYSGFGAPFNHESVGHPAHGNPVGVPPNQGNQQFPVSFPNALYTLGNNVYDSTPSSFSNNKEKDTVFLNQPQLPHAAFPGGPQPVVPRNEGVFYAVPGQAFSQGFRNQFHQPPGFAGQFPGGGFVTPPHNYHPPNQQGGNVRFR